ncbi:MAG: LPS export ABC transporter permease LptG [Desulfobacterales bacterium]|nr:LPS export ABC transporter permease LptG [Desulfobacterales bacterium]
MGILSKYFCKEFLKLLLLCQVIFVFIYLIIDFLQKIDNFVEAQASKGAMLGYFFYKTPHIIIQMAPVAILISVIIMFSLMKKNNEITALKSCGVSVLGFSFPVILTALGLSIATFFFSELLVPYASSMSNDIWDKEVKKRDQGRFYGHNHIWYKGVDSIYWIRHFDGKKLIMEDPTLYFFDDSFHLKQKIDARRAIWTGDTWRLEQGMIHELRDDNTYGVKRFERKDIHLPERPDVFLKAVKRPEEMSYWELDRYAEKVRLEGYDVSGFLVDKHMKLAFPLICFVMVLLGIPVALGLGTGGPPLAVSLGILTCFLYLFIMGFTRSLGFSGALPPILSAWLANVIFFFLGIYLMMHLRT